MPLRMTGMMSGMDTESIIQELVAAKQKKVDVKKKEQTKHEWKQDAWKELNTKLKNFQSKYLSNMRFTTSYSKKVSKVSNSSVASVITGEKAVNGVQTMRVKQLAKTGYLTGGKIEGKDGELTALSKLSDIKGFEGLAKDGTISIKTGSKSVDIQVNGDTTISDILTQVKDIGLNASFDAKQGRFFISSKESGLANDFSITASNSDGAKALAALGLQTDISKDAATKAEYQKFADYYVEGDRAATLKKMKTMIHDTVDQRVNSYLEQYKNLKAAGKASEDKLAEIDEKYGSSLLSTDEFDYDEALKNINDSIGALDKDSPTYETDLKNLQDQAADLTERKAAAETRQKETENLSKYGDQIADVEKYIDVTPDGEGGYTAEASTDLLKQVRNEYYDKAEYAYQAIQNPPANSATKVSGQDAIIYLNDAEFTNTNNTFEINGLTITALSESDENITITTEQDTDGIYDMVKNFLKEYNALVNEMDKLYNADSAKGYDPLLDDEKDKMSDSEVEKWEKKIKDSVLRRDSNLSDINSSLQAIMSAGIEIKGRTMYLSDFGINTLGYFNAPDNEKHAYHIDGDSDDEYSSGNSDKLKSMIANDPDTVIAFFTKLSQDLYGKMSDMSKSVKDYRTYGSFYDDKKMKSEKTDYEKKIAQMEQKVADYEDKWYRKFSKMETALAKMQSNVNAVSSLFGGGGS